MSPGAAVGPNMGHNTPTNVLALSGEQVKEQYKATAITSFFTSHPATSRPAPEIVGANACSFVPTARTALERA
jgi:hypothetical protein